MALFRRKDKETIDYLKKEVIRLRLLCKEKDSYFTELMSDGMRHGSSLAAKHMVDRREYLKNK